MSSLPIFPAATPDGRAIPFDIIRPNGVMRLTFGDTGTAAVALPSVPAEQSKIFALFSNTLCLVRFGGVAALPAHGAYIEGQMVVPGGTFINVDAKTATTISVMGLQEPMGGVPGLLLVISVDVWGDIRKNVQMQRR